MKRAAVVMSLMCLLAAPLAPHPEHGYAGQAALGQEPRQALQEPATSPFVIKTMESRISPDPGVVFTATPFVGVVYRVERWDLSDFGREVIFFEESLPKAGDRLGEFTVVSVDRGRELRFGKKFVREYTLTLQIIHEKKDEYVIPKITVFWGVRGPGQALQDIEQFTRETREITVEYRSVVSPTPYVHLRHDPGIGSFERRAAVLRYGPLVAAWIFGIGLVITFIVAWRRKSEAVASEEEVLKSEATQLHENAWHSLSPRQARKKLFDAFRQMESIYPADPHCPAEQLTLKEFQEDLRDALRAIVIAEVDALSDAHSNSEMVAYISEELPDTAIRRRLLELATSLAAYQEARDSGKVHDALLPHDRFLEEAARLKKCIRGLNRGARLWTAVVVRCDSMVNAVRRIAEKLRRR